MDKFKEDFILFLARTQALKFGEFTTKSGRQSPYFINAGSFRSGEHIETLGNFYADCIMNSEGVKDDFDILFGPAYKGVPLCISTACALYRKYNLNKEYCFNRKEIKDHGEGGMFIGASVSDGRKLILIEDVVTAGTAVREIVPLIREYANVIIKDMFILVDRLEIGYNGKTAPQEIKEEFGIKVRPIVTVREIIDFLYNRYVDGKVILGDEEKDSMERYLEIYCLE
ncbi:MAG: orotate phosphoribosyltransferase [Oscillospiraceae bacterium]|nr:orotate phosphoribosyltransferase [Oscillospiraceae bacterium]